jgi:hypothetical protein
MWGFPLGALPHTSANGHEHGDIYEEWKEETRLDINSTSGT